MLARETFVHRKFVICFSSFPSTKHQETLCCAWTDLARCMTICMTINQQTNHQQETSTRSGQWLHILKAWPCKNLLGITACQKICQLHHCGACSIILLIRSWRLKVQPVQPTKVDTEKPFDRSSNWWKDMRASLLHFHTFCIREMYQPCYDDIYQFEQKLSKKLIQQRTTHDTKKFATLPVVSFIPEMLMRRKKKQNWISHITLFPPI